MRLETPERYKRFLEKFGGLNHFGEPRFILQWCDSPIERIAVAPQLIGPYLNSWVLAEWYPPEEIGGRAAWDEELMGPYPSRGLYFPLQIFKGDDGREPAMLDSEWLNLEVLGRWVYNALNHEKDSLAKRKSVLDDAAAREKKAELERRADLLQDAFPAFGLTDSVSYAANPGATNSVKTRMEKIERAINAALDFKKRFPRGPSILNPAYRKEG